jgi:diguanylate cyclase (GGDEF)-like protein
MTNQQLENQPTPSYQELMSPVDDLRKRIEAQAGPIGSRVFEVMRESETDELTGLRNRKGLMNELQKRISSESSDSHFALVFVDLDGFKAVNDTHGHEAGDDVLAKVGKFFKEALKKDDPEDEGFKFRNDDEAFRLGGDEFVILIRTDKQGNGRRSTNKDEEETLEGFQSRLNRGIIDSGVAVDKDIEVSGSFGFAQYAHGESVKDFITRADKEMYKKKISKKALAEVDSFYEDIADNQQQRWSTKLGRESVVEINNRTYNVYDTNNITANFAYWAKQQPSYKKYFDFDKEYISDHYQIPEFMNNVFGQFVDKFPDVTKMLLTTNPQNRHDFSNVKEFRMLLGNVLFDYCAPELWDKGESPVELTK